MIYISGSGGFLGRNLVDQLDKNGIVLISDKYQNVVSSQKITISDFCSRQEFSTNDIFILAGNVYLKGNVDYKDIEPLIDYTLSQSTKMATYFLKMGGQKIINFRSYLELSCKEQPEGQSYYSTIKTVQADLIRRIAGVHKATVTDFILYDNFGIGDTRGKLITKLHHLVQHGGEIYIPNPEFCMDILPVGSQVRQIINATKNLVPGVYSIANGSQITIRELTNIATKINPDINVEFGGSSEVNFIPYQNAIFMEEIDIQTEIRRFLMLQKADDCM